MRELLEAVAAGECTPAAAEAELRGYATTDAGRFDAARTERAGVPEAVLAAGKAPAEVAELALTAIETTGRAIVTRADPVDVRAVRDVLDDAEPEATVRYDDRARWLTAHAPDFSPPDLPASVGVVAAGTADGPPASEAAMVLAEMGVTVERVADVGVAGVARIVDRLAELRDHDALVVAAGREGALPTVVAGLVDVPVVGLPTSTGYGHGGQGEAALAGMLQSCTALAVVNVDAGFTAGAQAGLVARVAGSARRERPSAERATTDQGDT